MSFLPGPHPEGSPLSVEQLGHVKKPVSALEMRAIPCLEEVESFVQTEDGIPPLTVRPLFSVDATGSVGRCCCSSSRSVAGRSPAFWNAAPKADSCLTRASQVWPREAGFLKVLAPAPCSIMRAEAELLASGVLCTTPAQLPHNAALQLYFCKCPQKLCLIPLQQVKQADFDSGQSVGAEFRAELRKLNRELLFCFLDLINTLVERPSAYARSVENVGLVARNMHYLLNALRGHQVSRHCWQAPLQWL